MASLTKEQIEDKQLRYRQVVDEAMSLRKELEAAGVMPVDDDALEAVAGGKNYYRPL